MSWFIIVILTSLIESKSLDNELFTAQCNIVVQGVLNDPVPPERDSISHLNHQIRKNLMPEGIGRFNMNACCSV